MTQQLNCTKYSKSKYYIKNAIEDKSPYQNILIY